MVSEKLVGGLVACKCRDCQLWTSKKPSGLCGPCQEAECSAAGDKDCACVNAYLLTAKRGGSCDHKFVDSNHCLKCGWLAPSKT